MGAADIDRHHLRASGYLINQVPDNMVGQDPSERPLNRGQNAESRQLRTLPFEGRAHPSVLR